MTRAGWIDFRALRKELSFEKVLKHYGVSLKIKGEQAQGFCPFPSHRRKRRSPSFSANLAKGAFQCFGCSAKGNVLDFAARMEGLDPFRGENIRTVALKLQEVFRLSGNDARAPTRSDEAEDVEKAEASPALPVAVNEPLDFELQGLDGEHPYLLKRGFTEETISTFGLGFCNRGLFKGRVVIPIHDAAGRLIAYAGRVVDDRSISEANPKYKVPAPRERNGKRYEFHKSQLLYNLHRLPAKLTDLVVVEGFPATWWLSQHGFTETVAVMGADCSEEQAKLVLDRVEFDGRIWIMSDGDEGGARLARNLFERVAPYRFVRWVKLRDGEQPTDCSAEDLAAMLTV